MDDKKLQKRIDFLEGLVIDIGMNLIMLINRVDPTLLPKDFQTQLSKDQTDADKRRSKNLLKDLQLLLAQKMKREK